MNGFYFVCYLLAVGSAIAGAANARGAINWTALALALALVPPTVYLAMEL